MYDDKIAPKTKLFIETERLEYIAFMMTAFTIIRRDLDCFVVFGFRAALGHLRCPVCSIFWRWSDIESHHGCEAARAVSFFYGPRG